VACIARKIKYGEFRIPPIERKMLTCIYPLVSEDNGLKIKHGVHILLLLLDMANI